MLLCLPHASLMEKTAGLALARDGQGGRRSSLRIGATTAAQWV